MKKILLIFSLFSGFCVLQAETSKLTLERIKLFQEISKAFPDLVNTCEKYNEMIEYSSMSQDFRNCSRTVFKLIQKAENIETEKQAEQFAKQLEKELNACKPAGEKELDAVVHYYAKNQLQLIKVAQQLTKAFPQEYAMFMAAASLRASQGHEMDQFTFQALQELQNIRTEEEAQAFTAKLSQKPEIQIMVDLVKENYQAQKDQKFN